MESAHDERTILVNCLPCVNVNGKVYGDED